MARKTKTSSNFKSTLEELSQLVDLMEKGDISLEQSLEHFERGIALTKTCQKILQDAEQKVEILMKNTDKNLKPFEEKSD